MATISDRLQNEINRANAVTSKSDTTVHDVIGSLIDGYGQGGAKDVNFYDYDGTLLHSYTLAEAQALTSLPPAPTHEGLVFQGWNWSLEDINALTRSMNVGAMYITDDGKTRLHIKIYDTVRANVPLYFSQTVSNGVTIDWGDGSATETLEITGNVNTRHQYSSTGDYIISLSVAEGCTLGLGHNITDYCVMGSKAVNGRVYCNLLQAVRIGNSVTSIGDYALQFCHSLSSITIPNSVISIGDYALQYCYSFSSITIPNSVTSIGAYAFDSCYPLSSITIPNSVTSIGDYAFRYCDSLTSITIPNSVTSIGFSVFNACSSLSSITIPNSVTKISNSMFYFCESLTSITIPNSVTIIGSNAFQYCKALTSITIPNSVTTIGNYAFEGCSSLSSITIPNGVTKINDYVFSECYSLSSITIPDNSRIIASYAFKNCYGIGAYHIKRTTPPSLYSSNAFSNIPSDCIIYVPKGCLDAYKSATIWSKYASYMREEEE